MQNKIAWISIGVFIAILAFGAVLLSRQGGTTPAVPSPTATPSAQPEEETVDLQDEETIELTIKGEEFSFSPSTAAVKAGTTIMLTFVNEGAMVHDLVFDEIDGATSRVSPGESETIELTINEPGTYTFYCSVAGHRALGMEGELVVE